MHDQVVDPAHPGGAVPVRLLRIREPQTVEQMHLRILPETAVQVVRDLRFCRGAGSLAGVRLRGLGCVLLRVHLEYCRAVTTGIVANRRSGD